MTGQWTGSWEVELGRAGLGLPGELGSDSGWGFPASLSCCSLPCGEPGFALCAPSTPCPAAESWSVLTTGNYLIGFYPDLGYCLSIWQSVSCDTGPLGTRQQKRPVWALFCPRARWPVGLSHYGLLCPQTPAVHSRSGSCLGYSEEAPFSALVVGWWTVCSHGLATGSLCDLGQRKSLCPLISVAK